MSQKHVKKKEAAIVIFLFECLLAGGAGTLSADAVVDAGGRYRQFVIGVSPPSASGTLPKFPVAQNIKCRASLSQISHNTFSSQNDAVLRRFFHFLLALLRFFLAACFR